MKWDQIVRELKAAGLKVVELPNWRTNRRPGSHSPKGVLVHHTAGTSDSYSYWKKLAFGPFRSDVPSPLAQIGLTKDGTVYMLAGGRANHAGKCRAWGNWLKKGDGNTQMIGIEAAHPGGSTPWPKAQYDAYVTLVAVICKVQGWGSGRVAGHKETSVTGKVDPNFSMGTFRGKVADRIKTLGQGLPDTGADWFDMATEKDLENALWKVLSRPIAIGGATKSAVGKDEVPLYYLIRYAAAAWAEGRATRTDAYYAHHHASRANERAARIEAAVADVDAAVWGFPLKNSVYGGESKAGDVLRAAHRAATVAGDLWPEDDTAPDSAAALKDHEEESK